MEWYHIILYQMIFLTSPSLAGDYSTIIDQLKPNTITIIGEQHKHSESIILFQKVITDYLKRNECLT